MSLDKTHFHCFINFNRERTAIETFRNLDKMFGYNAVMNRTCRNWFRKFKHGDLKDEAKSE